MNRSFVSILASLAVVAGIAAGASAQAIGPIVLQPATTAPATQPATQPVTTQPADPKVKPVFPSGPVTVGPNGPLATMPTTGPSTQPAVKTDTIEGCQQALNCGQYASAAEGFKKFLDKEKLSATLGLAGCLSMQGKYTEAIDALKAAGEDGAKDARWQLAMAELLNTTGKYEEALAAAVKATELRAAWAPAILFHGQMLELLGKKTEAIEVYKTMGKVITENKYGNDARSLVALGQIMDRYNILLGKKASDQASNILQNYLQQSYLVADKKYWQGNIAAGQFLLGNSRPNQAGAEFKLAQKINPNLPDVHVGYGQILLAKWQFEQVIAEADKALAINPNFIDALILKATCIMQWRKFEEVEPILANVFKINPNHLDALSLMAAAEIRMGHADKAKEYSAKVEKINAKYVGLPMTIGEWLTAGKQYKEAEPYYLKAIELSPELAEPKSGIGMMYLQVGQEDKAREYLKQAFAINNFREDINNYINLLDKMLGKADDPKSPKYLVKETEHFVATVDPVDHLLLDQISDYMESIYPIICGDYDYQMPGKTYIEFFPTHQDFSVRLTGKEGIPTVGACTGNCIVMATPAKDRTGGVNPYNWAVVLRHEFTHVVTITGSGNHIPHWFTESCAVHQQPDKQAYKYIMDLVNATRSGQLYSVKELDWGFIRPKSMAARQLAYAQAEWALQFIIKKKGYQPTVADMIKGFRDGLTQKEVFEKVLGMTEEQFDKEFREWAIEQVKEWRFDPNPPPNLQAAAAEAKNNPRDPAAQAALASAMLSAGQVKPAEAVARAALDLDPNNTRALAVLGYVLAGNKKTDEAIGMAKRLEDVDKESYHAAKIMAMCYLEKHSWADAIAALESYKARQPLDQFSYEQLAKYYTESGDSEAALPNLLALHRLTVGEAQYARRIAEIYRVRKVSLDPDADDARKEEARKQQEANYRQAMGFYRETLYVNPFAPDIYERMATLQTRLKEYKQALGSAQNIGLADAESADSWTKATAAQFWVAKATGDKAAYEMAKESAQKALKIDPECKAKEFLSKIEEALKN